MKTVSVNIPILVYRNLQTYDKDTVRESPTLSQLKSMHPDLEYALSCLATACQRQLFLDSSYDLGEPKSEIQAGWAKADKDRFEKDETDMQHERSEVPGIPRNDPEYEYMKEKLQESK